jgi:sporulation protein YlmC with PRC-barrel domain
MRVFPAAVIALVAAPAVAQDLPSPGDLTGSSAIASAAQSLLDQTEERLLVRDLLGKELKGADGEVVGTVENLAVAPGGRVIAAIVSTEDMRIAVPFGAVKLAAAGSGLEATVPASELTSMSELQSLAESLTQ